MQFIWCAHLSTGVSLYHTHLSRFHQKTSCKNGVGRVKIAPFDATHEALAQLVEQLTFNQWVEGSSPSCLTIRRRNVAQLGSAHASGA